tara:strand:+ start:2756 stop:3154 length:399 start_codon:yes stop_codon:yes gene_type:complete
MSVIRTSLLAQLTTNLTGSNVSVSAELPFSSGGDVLYAKNMKTLYVDEEQIEQETLYETLDRSNINTNLSTVNAYLQVDAKTQLSDINTIISSVLSAKSVITDTITSESDYTTEITLDHIVYTYQFRFDKTI